MTTVNVQIGLTKETMAHRRAIMCFSNEEKLNDTVDQNQDSNKTDMKPN